jgi:hypothetical protein
VTDFAVLYALAWLLGGMVMGYAFGRSWANERAMDWLKPSWARVSIMRANALGLEGTRLTDFSVSARRPGEPNITLRLSGGQETRGWMPE